MRFALEVRAGRPAAIEFGEELTEIIRRQGGEVVTEDGVRPDMVLAVGGDGTMLAAARRSLAEDVPVLGFNLGTLGFLAEAEPAQAKEVVKRLVEGDYDVEERLTVAASIQGSRALGINDVVVEKVDTTRLVSLGVVVDGSDFATYRADGLVLATPTGSTAYSLSAGGPLVDSRVQALVMTPVAAHSLFDRAMVLPESSVVEVRVIGERQVRVNVDKGVLGELGEGERVVIRRGERNALFVTFHEPGFPGRVREKFGLG